MHAKVTCLGGNKGDSEVWGRRMQQVRAGPKLLWAGLTNQGYVAVSANDSLVILQ